jgi:hypothetical protein
MTTITGTLHQNVCTFMTISLQILLRMRNISDIICSENKSRLFYIQQRFSENLGVCEITWGNMVKPDMSQVTV